MNTRGGGRWSRESKLTSAWAGNLTSRVGREHVVYVQDKAKSAGSSRVGGEHKTRESITEPYTGRSPRGRGTHLLRLQVSFRHREIPAWAGNTPRRTDKKRPQSGDPRVGGEHNIGRGGRKLIYGRSPRGRGTRLALHKAAEIAREIPAWAGNTWPRPQAGRSRAGDPRVGGEHPAPPAPTVISSGRSPRGRGTLNRDRQAVVRLREIPAWAGNTPRQSLLRRLSLGDPRVGGEHLPNGHRLLQMAGRSPRGRGTPL